MPEPIGTDYDENQSVLPHYSLHPFSPGCWGAGACCCLRLELDQDRNQPGFYLSVLSSPFQSSPLSLLLHPFFSSFFKWRTVMVCIEVVWEAGNGGGGGEKVIGCTIASHTAFNCFSPTHSRKWKVRSAGQYVLMYVLLYALWKIGLWCRFYSPLFVSDTFFAQKNTTKKIHHPKPALFSLARRQGSSPYRALPERWGKTTKNWN